MTNPLTMKSWSPLPEVTHTSPWLWITLLVVGGGAALPLRSLAAPQDTRPSAKFLRAGDCASLG